MRRPLLVLGFVLAATGAVIVFFGGCNGKLANNNGGALGGAPHLLRVYNGSTLGFYTPAGAYGFQSQTASVISFNQNYGVGQQFAQNTSNGFLYFGTTQCSGNCNMVIAINGQLGGFRSGNFADSFTNLTTAGTTPGLSVDNTNAHLYSADPVHGTVDILNASIGTMIAGPIFPGSGLGARFTGADTYNHRVVVTENNFDAAWFLDGTAYTMMGTGVTPFRLTSASCLAANVGPVVVNSAIHYAYVLCGSTVVFLSTNGTPNFEFGSAAASTFALANIASGTDIVWDSNYNLLVVSGGNFVTAISSLTGATATSLDVTTGNCGFGAADLQGLAYDSNSHTVFVADNMNSVIYELDDGTLNFKNGSCTNSSFSTSTDVTGPKRISFY